MMSRELVLRQYINQVKENYDYVLIDCMPSLGMLTINEFFNWLIQDYNELEHLEFFEGLRRAPLALFDVFDLVEYFKKVVLDEVEIDSYHPAPYLRKAHLLDNFDFGDDEECFNLYLVISEQVSALKYYIYKYKDTMGKEIRKIHERDRNLLKDSTI